MKKGAAQRESCAGRICEGVDLVEPQLLLLPGPFLVTVGAQLLAPFVFINFALASFFQ
jgi:hypothetical protein